MNTARHPSRAHPMALQAGTGPAGGAPARRKALLVAGAGRQAPLRLQMSRQLQAFDIVSAADGAAAIGLLGQGLRPDLVLADAQAAGVADASFSARVRACLHSTPIVVVSILRPATAAEDAALAA
ncbi:MAG: response regulator [Rubrivivax sp.]